MKKNIIKSVIALVFVVGAIISFNVETKANVPPVQDCGCNPQGLVCSCAGYTFLNATLVH